MVTTGDQLTGRVLVVGAGWAGMAAAWALCRQGASVTLVDARHYPGGRAFSFRDPVTGLWLDNGQHVLLGCCTAVQDLLAEIGESEAVTFDRLNLPVHCGGRWWRIQSRPWPGPLHIVPALLGYGPLSLRERLAAVRVGGVLRRAGRAETLDGESFQAWLARHGQSPAAIGRLWDLVGVSVLNAHADAVSAGQAVAAFRLGVVAGWQAARLGLFRKPLGILAERMAAHLRAQGVELRLGGTAREFLWRDGRVIGVRVGEETLSADAVIAAVPARALAALLGASPSEAGARAVREAATGLAVSPIVNVYLVYDRPVMDKAFFAVADRVSQFVFNRGRLLDPGSEWDGRFIAVSISGARDLRDRRGRLGRTVAEEMAEILPRAGTAHLTRVREVWQPEATFWARPGTWELRTAGGAMAPGLAVAGDWTDTGWPASLESAVRSGNAAAEQVISVGLGN